MGGRGSLRRRLPPSCRRARLCDAEREGWGEGASARTRVRAVDGLVTGGMRGAQDVPQIATIPTYRHCGNRWWWFIKRACPCGTRGALLRRFNPATLALTQAPLPAHHSNHTPPLQSKCSLQQIKHATKPLAIQLHRCEESLLPCLLAYSPCARP